MMNMPSVPTSGSAASVARGVSLEDDAMLIAESECRFA
jgi:hypothetical protein